MSRYLYISDVYCPWCYAFGLVFDSLLEKYPLPVRVLCGELVDEPTTIEEKLASMPSMKARFQRMTETTGRVFGTAYLDLLDPGRGGIVMDSRAMSVPLTALRHLVPGREREQLEALQAAFYHDGLDVMDPAVQAKATGVSEEALRALCAREDIRAEAAAELEEGTEILDEFLIYPTLFLERDNGGRVALARGYTDLATVCARLEGALTEQGLDPASPADGKETEGPATGHACGPDGCCLL